MNQADNTPEKFMGPSPHPRSTDCKGRGFSLGLVGLVTSLLSAINHLLNCRGDVIRLGSGE